MFNLVDAQGKLYFDAFTNGLGNIPSIDNVNICIEPWETTSRWNYAWKVTAECVGGGTKTVFYTSKNADPSYDYMSSYANEEHKFFLITKRSDGVGLLLLRSPVDHHPELLLPGQELNDGLLDPCKLYTPLCLLPREKFGNRSISITKGVKDFKQLYSDGYIIVEAGNGSENKVKNVIDIRNNRYLFSDFVDVLSYKGDDVFEYIERDKRNYHTINAQTGEVSEDTVINKDTSKWEYVKLEGDDHTYYMSDKTWQRKCIYGDYDYSKQEFVNEVIEFDEFRHVPSYKNVFHSGCNVAKHIDYNRKKRKDKSIPISGMNMFIRHDEQEIEFVNFSKGYRRVVEQKGPIDLSKVEIYNFIYDEKNDWFGFLVEERDRKYVRMFVSEDGTIISDDIHYSTDKLTALYDDCIVPCYCGNKFSFLRYVDKNLIQYKEDLELIPDRCWEDSKYGSDHLYFSKDDNGLIEIYDNKLNKITDRSKRVVKVNSLYFVKNLDTGSVSMVDTDYEVYNEDEYYTLTGPDGDLYDPCDIQVVKTGHMKIIIGSRHTDSGIMKTLFTTNGLSETRSATPHEFFTFGEFKDISFDKQSLINRSSATKLNSTTLFKVVEKDSNNTLWYRLKLMTTVDDKEYIRVSKTKKKD